jgi:hypothetical protein
MTPRRRLRQLAVGGLVLGGATAVTLGLTGSRERPTSIPPAISVASGEHCVPNVCYAPSRSAAARLAAVMPRSEPTRLDIPAIGVHSALLQLGLNPDGTVEVPPLARDSRAGWYRHSPTPGQLGPAVILGHVDSAAYGPGVFFRLSALHPGSVVDVTRADGRVARFHVERVAEYSKAEFPTDAVYGNTDHAALRLITCGGTFDRSTGSYRDNVVALASLVRN